MKREDIGKAYIYQGAARNDGGHTVVTVIPREAEPEQIERMRKFAVTIHQVKHHDRRQTPVTLTSIPAEAGEQETQAALEQADRIRRSRQQEEANIEQRRS